MLRRFQGGKEDAATELYRRYAARLLDLAEAKTSPDVKQRVDPEDIVQSVFRTFFRRASLGEYEVPDSDELWKLFLVIGLNKIRAVAGFHKAAKRDVRLTASGDAMAAVGTGADDVALRTLQLTIDELLAPLWKSVGGPDAPHTQFRGGRNPRTRRPKSRAGVTRPDHDPRGVAEGRPQGGTNLGRSRESECRTCRGWWAGVRGDGAGPKRSAVR